MILNRLHTAFSSLLQLMAAGHLGKGGDDARRHATAEKRNVTEAVPIPLLLMAAKIVLVKMRI